MKFIALIFWFLSATIANATNIYNIEDYGAVADFIEIGDGAMTTGQQVLTSPSGAFTSADVGKIALVNGAGNQGINGTVLISKIDVYTSPSEVGLHNNALHTVSGARYQYATDSTPAIQSAINACKITGGDVRANFAGKYGVTHLNATNSTRSCRFTGVGPQWWGSRWVPMADGGAVLDLTGHDAFVLKNFAIGGSNGQLALPIFGIIAAPSTVIPGMDVPVFDEFYMDGSFRTSGAYIDRVFGGRVQGGSFMNYWQGSAAGVSSSIHFTGHNEYNIQSAYATTLAWGTSGALSNWSFTRTEFHNMNSNPVGGALSFTIRQDGLQDSIWVGGLIAASYISPIYLGPNVKGNTYIGTVFAYDMTNGYSYVFYGDANSDYTTLINVNPNYASSLHPMAMGHLSIIGRQ